MDLSQPGTALTALADKSQQELQNFVYVVSHDLNAPLRHIQNYLGFVLEDHSDSLDAEGLEFLQIGLQNANRMQAMLDSLLAYSRIETTERTFVAVDLNQSMALVSNTLRKLLDKKQVQLSISTLPTVLGDEQQLASLFEYIIANAVQHNPNPSPSVTINVQFQDKMATILIEDNGPGVASAHQDRVFEMFQRIGGRHEQHMGAGLTIARKIAERHGGHLEFDAKANNGAIMRLSLPIYAEQLVNQA